MLFNEVPRQISTHVCLQPQLVSEVPRLLRPLHMSLVTETNFAVGSYEKFQPGFRDELKAFSSPEPVVSWSRGRLQIKPSGSGDENELKANDPGDEFRHKGTNKADMRNTKIINFAPIIAFATLKAISLQLTGMLMMRKMQQAMQDDSIWARIHPAFIPVTGLTSHMAKFPARLGPFQTSCYCRAELNWSN